MSARRIAEPERLRADVIRAWERQQRPEVLTAIGHAFCEHSHTGLRCLCLTEQDKDAISAWVTRTVMRALPFVIRRGRSVDTIVVDVDGTPTPLVDALSEPDCWYPFCTKAPRHRGQHNGILQAGRRLAELEAAIAEGTLVWKVA